jgi:hypothetical protein
MNNGSTARWRTWGMTLLVAIFSVLSYGIALLNQNIDDVKRVADKTAEIAKQNDRFVDNFSNYMNCLIIGEDDVVRAVGEEVYVDICKQLLYRGINPIPPTIKAQIPEFTPTTTSTRP